MDTWLPLWTAFWLGILTSISPCPLATNIAAMSFLARDVKSPARVLLNGVLYAAGRTLCYLFLGVLIVGSLVSIYKTAQFLQVRVNFFLGPVLILAGLFLLGWLRWPARGGTRMQQLGLTVSEIRWIGPLLLGSVFALSFCPVSAGLFFGSLIPMSATKGSVFLYPALYGIGTALPVVVFAVLLALGFRWVGIVFNRLRAVERWARQMTGVVVLGAGVYWTLRYSLGWQL